MLRALDEYEIAGCRTTIPFCEFTLRHKSFRDANYDTHFVQNHFTDSQIGGADVDESVIALSATLLRSSENIQVSNNQTSVDHGSHYSNWWKNRR